MLKHLFGLSSPDLAIDLGTANTLIAAQGQGVLLNEPSVVAVEEGTRVILAQGRAVGRVARQLVGRAPASVSVVRPLRDGAITDFELCEAMLRHFLKKTLGAGWRPGPRVLVAASGGASPVEKRALFNSAERAGAREVLLAPAVKLAAIGAGLPILEPIASMILLIGAGATEVAILSLGEIVRSQSLRIGGDTMDQAIIDYLRRKHGLRVGGEEAERLRIEIGAADRASQKLLDEARGVDLTTSAARKLTLDSEEIREALAAPLAAIIDAIKQTLHECPANLTADLADRGLVLAGGAAQLRGLDLYLACETGLPTRLADEPMAAVARGALVCLERPGDWRDMLEANDDL